MHTATESQYGRITKKIICYYLVSLSCVTSVTYFMKSTTFSSYYLGLKCQTGHLHHNFLLPKQNHQVTSGHMPPTKAYHNPNLTKYTEKLKRCVGIKNGGKTTYLLHVCGNK